jgi:hypothetical protein
MMSLVATPGASNANSYATVEEANAYFTTRLHSDTWLDATVSEKEAALIMATRLIDAHYSNAIPATLGGIAAEGATLLWGWSGAPASSTQALCWPRTGMFNRNGFAISSSIIPQELKDATAEFAWQLLGTDRTLDSDVESQGITQVTAGPITVKFKDDVSAKVIPDAVHSLLITTWVVSFPSEWSYAALPPLFQVL